MLDVADWLAQELKKRSWSRRELARRAGISHTWVADVIKGHEPSWDFCAAVASPFGMSPVEMLLVAGKLTSSDVRRALPTLPADPVDPSDELSAVIRELSPKHQQALLVIARDLVASS